jgi:hypothetical protein
MFLVVYYTSSLWHEGVAIIILAEHFCQDCQDVRMTQCYITLYIGFCISSLVRGTMCFGVLDQAPCVQTCTTQCGAGQMQPDMFSVAAQSRAHFFSIDAKAP